MRATGILLDTKDEFDGLRETIESYEKLYITQQTVCELSHHTFEDRHAIAVRSGCIEVFKELVANKASVVETNPTLDELVVYKSDLFVDFGTADLTIINAAKKHKAVLVTCDGACASFAEHSGIQVIDSFKRDR